MQKLLSDGFEEGSETEANYDFDDMESIHSESTAQEKEVLETLEKIDVFKKHRPFPMEHRNFKMESD